MGVGVFKLDETILELIKDGRVVLALLLLNFFHVFVFHWVKDLNFRFIFVFIIEVDLIYAEFTFIFQLVHILAEDVFGHRRV